MSISILALLALSAPVQDVRFTELHRMLPRLAGGASEVLFGDVDSDLDVDVVFLRGGEDRVLRNAGDGRFEEAPASALPATSAQTGAAALGDVDGDGTPDLLRALVAAPPSLSLGDGAGGFTEVGFPSSDVFFPDHAVFADVDVDGDLDAVVAGLAGLAGGGSLELFAGDGAGGFVEVADWVPYAGDLIQALEPADLNGDGAPELLLSHGLPGLGNRLYRNLGDGGFVDASAGLPTAPDNTTDFAAADVDGDGDVDVFSANASPSVWCRLWINDGFAAFTVGALPPTPKADRAIFFDADLDGDQDLIVSARNSAGWGHALCYFEGDGAGGFAELVQLLPDPERFTTALAAADVDGDGDTDMLRSTGGAHHLWLSNGKGSFQESAGDAALDAEPALLGDLDADGFPDALLIGRESSYAEKQLFLGSVGGVFTPAHELLPGGTAYTLSGALGDLDGDGDLDVFWGNFAQDGQELNDGHAHFVDAGSGLPSSTVQTQDAALADLDGDGDLDVVRAEFPTDIGAPTDGRNSVLRNDGGAVFSDLVGAFPPIFDLSYDLELGDADGDGDLDALVRSSGLFAPGTDRLYVNDGAGVFAEVPGSLPQGGWGGRLAWADFDGDAVLEVFLGGGVQGADRYLESDGAGHFTDASGALPPGSAGTLEPIAADLDEDGALDLFLARGETATILRGDGSGAFEGAGGGLPALNAELSRVSLADLDGDGDVDAWLAGDDAASALLFNQSRGVARRAPPRIGKALVLDVDGPPQSPWALLFAGSLSTLELPPYGTLYLPANQMAFLGFGALDAEGRAELELAIPSDPALIGAEFFAQGTVGAPARLTNPERARFTDL